MIHWGDMRLTKIFARYCRTEYWIILDNLEIRSQTIMFITCLVAVTSNICISSRLALTVRSYASEMRKCIPIFYWSI